jgi:hypothetical protein
MAAHFVRPITPCLPAQIDRLNLGVATIRRLPLGDGRACAKASPPERARAPL